MKKWLVPCNVKNFDLINHFRNNETSYFKKNRDIRIGDEVYIYVAKPYSEIKYKGIVIKSNILSDEVGKEYKSNKVGGEKFFQIKLTIRFPDHSLCGKELKQHGLGQFVNQQLIRGPIEQYINDIEQNLPI